MLAGSVRRKLQPQQVGEQVVAKPGAARVDRAHEGVGLLELLQDPLRTRGTGEEVGQRPAHPVEDRGPQQKLADLRRLALEHLRHQVAADVPLAAGELAHEPLWSGCSASEIASRRPATHPSVRS